LHKLFLESRLIILSIKKFQGLGLGLDGQGEKFSLVSTDRYMLHKITTSSKTEQARQLNPFISQKKSLVSLVVSDDSQCYT